MNNLKKTPVSNNLIVYTSDLDSFFETMVADQNFDECEILRTNDKKEALKNHSKMVSKYTFSEEVITLANTLKLANEEAQKCDYIEDGGSCNFDSVTINLKGKRKDFINQLELLSGFHIDKISSKIWAGFYFVHFNLKGQANRRTKMAQTANNFLQQNNINSTMYYQLD